MENYSSFGEWLQAQRRANDLTQNQLAQQVFCAEITIRKIEAGHLRPSRQLAALLVDAIQKAAAREPDLISWARRR